MSAVTTQPPIFVRARAYAERTWDNIDRAMLRLGGRLDTPSYDRGLPYAFAIVHGALLIILVLARYNQLDHGFETAKYSQALWQIGEGFKPVTTLSDGNLLAEQGSLILYPLGLITAVLPRIETLLVIRSIALAITVVPLWRLARRHGQLGIAATSTIAFAYMLYTYVHNMNVTDFAPSILAVPALMYAVLAGFDERKRLMTVAIIFVLCCRADLGLAVAGLGILLLLERRRKVGAIALTLGFLWFLAAMYGLQRGLSDGGYPWLAPYSEFGLTPLRVVGGIISHPVRFAQEVGTQVNFQILVALLAPVLFLPLTAPRYLMPAVPLYVLYTGAEVPFGRLREAAQAVPMTVFVFVATVFALKRTGRILVKRVRVERRIILALLLTAIVFFVRDSSTSPYSEPWLWGERDALDISRVNAIEAVPEDEPVRASASMLPLLSDRIGVYAFDVGVGEIDPTDPEIRVPLEARLVTIANAAVNNVDWIILDRELEGLDDAEVLGTLRIRIADLGFELQTADAHIDVYRFTGILASVPVTQDDFGFGDTFDGDG